MTLYGLSNVGAQKEIIKINGKQKKSSEAERDLTKVVRSLRRRTSIYEDVVLK